MSGDHDVFSERGITPPWHPDGHVARAQGFERYEGADWRARRAIIAEVEPLYGDDRHPDTDKARELRHRARLRLVEGHPELRNAVAAALDIDPDEGYRWTEATPALRHIDEELPARVRDAWRSWLRSALAVDGWLLPRHAIMPESPIRELRERPVAQLRPDRPVVFGRGWEWHHHSFDLRRAERRAHESAVCEKGIAGHPANVEHPDGDYLETGHLHPTTGEVVVPTAGRHPHWDHAKYVYTPGATALRLGTNPLVLERGFGAAEDLFVVVMEGTLKMCSVVEAGYPCIDAGSVTLWHGGVAHGEVDELGEHVYTHTELEEFAELHLRGRRVAVVMDSDWHRNDLVLDQTRRVVALLKSAGAHAIAAAPPEGESYGWEHRGVEMRAKVGVDDWLGSGRSLLDLAVQVPGRPRREALADAASRATDVQRTRERIVTMLEPFVSGVGPDGVAPFSPSALAEQTGDPERTIKRWVTKLDPQDVRLVAEAVPHMNAGKIPARYWIGPHIRPERSITTLRDWMRLDLPRNPWI